MKCTFCNAEVGITLNGIHANGKCSDLSREPGDRSGQSWTVTNGPHQGYGKCDGDAELSLLVIDLGDSCVVKVEKGCLSAAQRESIIACFEPSFEGQENEDEESWTDIKAGFVWAIAKSFTDIRAAIDALDAKPVPRIEQEPDSDRYFNRLRIFFNDTSYPLVPNAVHALKELGVRLPIYEPKQGTWTQLTAFDWSAAKASAGFAGYGVDAHSFEATMVPFKAWRYTR